MGLFGKKKNQKNAKQNENSQFRESGSGNFWDNYDNIVDQIAADERIEYQQKQRMAIEKQRRFEKMRLPDSTPSYNVSQFSYPQQVFTPTTVEANNGVQRTVTRFENNPDVDCKSKFLVGTAIDIGRREYQQDALNVSDDGVTSFGNANAWMAVLCDGMGGMNGGEKASSLCVEGMIKSFSSLVPGVDVLSFFRDSLVRLDDEVFMLADDFGNQLGAGSTLISVIIHNNILYFASVGDSHIYLIRNNTISLLNKEHNYLQELLVEVENGNLSYEEAYNDPYKEALTSYMGIGGLELIDVNCLELQDGDFIVLSSDGLYRSLSDEEIMGITQTNVENMQLAASRLVGSAIMKGNPHQDNTSAITIKYVK